MNNSMPTFEKDSILNVQYEIFRECVNCEISFHTEQVHILGKGTPEGSLHFNAIRDLVELRNSIKPCDTSAASAVILALKAAQAGRYNHRSEQTQISESSEAEILPNVIKGQNTAVINGKFATNQKHNEEVRAKV